MTSSTTRTWRLALSVLTMLLLLAACAQGGGGGDATATGDDTAAGGTETAGGGESGQAEGEPFRIGILAPFTGVFATFGPKVIEEPIRLYLEQHDNQLGGRPVEVITVDAEGDPTVMLEGARRLKNEDVDVVVGLVNSAAALAVRDYLDQQKMVTIITVAGARELTQDRKSDYIFRISFANGQTEAAGALLARESGIESMAGIGADYVAPHQLLEPLLEHFQELGGTVETVLWHPLDTADFSSYLTDLARVEGSVDAISPMMFGADSVRFFEQYQDFGIDVPLYAFGDVTEQTLFLDQVGEAAVGTTTYWNYSPYLDNPANNDFREAFLETYDRLPGGFSMHAYSAMQFLDQAVSEMGADGDSDALVAALEGLQIDSPSGPMEFDEDHGVVFNVYLNEIREGPDGIVAQIPLGPMVTNVHQHQTLEEAQENLTEIDGGY